MDFTLRDVERNGFYTQGGRNYWDNGIYLM